MKFRIESPGFRSSSSLKEFTKKKLGTLDKYYKDIQELEVTLLNEVKANKEVVNCTLNIRIPGRDEYIRSSSYIFEDAILKAAEAAKRRLKSRKTQLDNMRKKKAAAGKRGSAII